MEKDEKIYNVVKNHLGQYSIWPSEKENALGWFNEGVQGSKNECLQYINSVWKDLNVTKK